MPSIVVAITVNFTRIFHISYAFTMVFSPQSVRHFKHTSANVEQGAAY